MKLEQLNPGTKLKVTKDIYYIAEDSVSECEYLTYEELMNSVAHLLVKDDVYKVTDEAGEKFIECIEGTWKGESNDGWFDVDEMIEKDALEIIK